MAGELPPIKIEIESAAEKEYAKRSDRLDLERDVASLMLNGGMIQRMAENLAQKNFMRDEVKRQSNLIRYGSETTPQEDEKERKRQEAEEKRAERANKLLANQRLQMVQNALGYIGGAGRATGNQVLGAAGESIGNIGSGIAAGAAAGAAGGPYGMIAGAIGGAIKSGMSEMAGYARSGFEKIGQFADKASETNPFAAQAKAMADVTATLKDIERSNSMGPELADFISMRAQLEQTTQDLLADVVAPFIPIAIAFMNGVRVILDWFKETWNEDVIPFINSCIEGFNKMIELLKEIPGVSKDLKGISLIVKRRDMAKGAENMDFIDQLRRTRNPLVGPRAPAAKGAAANQPAARLGFGAIPGV